MIWAAVAMLSMLLVLLFLPAPISTGTAAYRPRCGVSRLTARLRGQHRLTPAALRRDSAELLRQLSALLQSGRSPAQAWGDLLTHWRSLAGDHPLTRICSHAVAAESSGGTTSEGLRRAVRDSPEAELDELVHRLIAVTALSEQTGTALSHLVEQLARAVDDSDELTAAVTTAVAGPKMTQLILTLLPAAGLVLGHMMGAAPLGTLFGSGVGLLCLLGGLALLAAGRLWSGRMITAVMGRV